jgi:hypothetical protein
MHGSQGLSRSVLLGVTLSLSLVATGCSKSGLDGGGGSNGSGGNPGSGGTVKPGGSAGGAATGGKPGTGGGSGSGGLTGKAGQNGSGGKSGSGGSSQTTGAGGLGSCSNVEPCGGDLVGAWTVLSTCMKVTGELDLSLAGTGCSSAPVTGSLQVAGTWTAKADGKYTDETITTGSEQFTLGPTCLVISSTPVTCDGAANLLTSVLGYESLTCTANSGGGCDCSAAVKQTGGLGVLSMVPATAGKYTVAANVVTLTGDLDDTPYSYCASPNKLTLTPQVKNPTMTGTIVLEKGRSTGSGGATASGGRTGSGGRSGLGGAAGSAGAGSGGAAGTTGNGGTGGRGGSGGTPGSGGATAAGGSTGGGHGTGPCDIYAAASNPCVAAHSVVRALYGAYNGKLYQVKRSSDNTTKDIVTFEAGGIADTAPEDTFCAGSTCSLTAIYDQSGKGNDLWYQGSEQVPASPQSSAPKATADSVNVAGHKIYSAYIRPGNCFWHDGSKTGMATGSQPEGMYMVTSARNTNAGCCFDYGNSETTRSADVGGAMDSINISSITAWGTGAGKGPWIMADLEWGVFCQGDNKNNPNCPTQTAPFVTAVIKNNGTTEYAIRGGDATAGALTTYYKGRIPYNPMKKQGAIILGCGGDCCKPSGGANASSGIFFEGAIVTGYPTDATEEALQANIVTVGYGK